MTRIMIIFSCFAPALAYVGHVGGLASHHWVAAAAIAAALKGRGVEAAKEHEPELQEA
jgi:hypothetical protein